MFRNPFAIMAATAGPFGCIPLIIYIVLGTIAVNFDIGIIFGKHLPVWLAFLAALLFGWLSIVLAVIGMILKVAGVHVPLVH